jgi:membrane protein DedA with SNARE-associated domain
MEGIGQFLTAYGVLALFVVMLLKEIGVPIPIPSDLLMIGAGVQIASGAYGVPELLLALAVAALIGGSFQFFVARSAGRAVVYRLAAKIGVGAERLDRAIERIGSGGTRAVVVGLNVPGARAAVIPAAGLARMSFVPFAAATVVGSLIFYGWHIALGYVVGPAAGAILERSATLLVAGVVALGVLGAVGWWLLRRRARSGAVVAWTEAACPACLAINALRR